MGEKASVEVAQNGHDYEVDVIPTQIGITIMSTDEDGNVMRMPRLSSDDARCIARQLIAAADLLDAM